MWLGTQRFLKSLAKYLVLIGLVGGLSLGLLVLYLNAQLPDVEHLSDMHMQVPLRIYSRSGLLIAQYGEKKRTPVTLSQVPKPLIQAVLAVEDARFYHHPGVDWVSLLRAARAVISSGKKVQGASTITMQVARNFFLSPEKTYLRKAKEIILSLKIDRSFSKDSILSLYLNKVYFGHRAYGVAAAAQTYYGKQLSELSLPEMAMIAGLPQAPSRNNPLARPEAALKRRNHVLSRMQDLGVISQADCLAAQSAPITAQYHEPATGLSAPYVAEKVRLALVERFGSRAYEAGFRVTTTVDAAAQRAANQSLSAGLLAYSERHGYWPYRGALVSDLSEPSLKKALSSQAPVGPLVRAVVRSVATRSAEIWVRGVGAVHLPWAALSWARPAYRKGFVGPKPTAATQIIQAGQMIWVRRDGAGWRLSQIPRIQGALVSLDPQTGDVLALVGGFSYARSHFDRATQAKRQPGSAFKPFIYGAALAKGFTLASLINDAPLVLQDSGENQWWRPQNDSRHFYGPTRLREGLVHSRNLMSIRLLQATGVPFARHYLSSLGFEQEALPDGLSLALGAGSTTPLSLTQAYATIAAGGKIIEPRWILQVTDATGRVIWDASQQPSAPSVQSLMTPQAAYLLYDALQDVLVHGTGKALAALKRPDLAGKTGTTNNKVDAWFSGFNGYNATTVWVGFDDATAMHEYGSQAALPIFQSYMASVLKDSPLGFVKQPPGLVTVRIDPATGLLAGADQDRAVFELFRAEQVPIDTAPNATVPQHGGPPGGQTPLF